MERGGRLQVENFTTASSAKRENSLWTVQSLLHLLLPEFIDITFFIASFAGSEEPDLQPEHAGYSCSFPDAGFHSY
jgi:hypothetical protein